MITLTNPQRENKMKFQVIEIDLYTNSSKTTIVEGDDVVDCIVKYYKDDDEDFRAYLRQSLIANEPDNLCINEDGGWKLVGEEELILITEV